MDQKFEIGETVILKSGGPDMTIIFLWSNGSADCVWLQRDGLKDKITLPTVCLKRKEYTDA